MKNKDFLELDFYDIKAFGRLSRREFIKIFGGGIVVFYSLGDSFALQEERRSRGMRPEAPEDFNAYLLVKADGTVACFTGKIEMGQGVVTSLAQELADELDVALDSVEMVMGDTDLCPWDMGTFGSMTTRFFGPELRAAAAEARAVLIELAAEHLKLPASQLEAKDGVIRDLKNKKNQVTYAQLTGGKKIERHLEKKPPVKNPAEFTIVNQPLLRRDSNLKVTGQAKYAGDALFPDVLHARILRPPSHDAKLKSVDISEAEKIAGVQIIREGDFIAALHKYPDVAEKALAKIKAQFDRPAATVDDKNIFEHLLKVAPQGEVAAQGGNLMEGEKAAQSIVEKKYLNSYVAHAPIEPHTATAKIDGDRITVWASTQTPFGLKDETAQALGLQPQNVRVITPFVGGGFGGKTSNQQGVEAARLAKLVGKPVQVAWTRAEEFFYDTFRPAAIVKIKSGITNSGKIVFWDYGVYFAGQRGAEQFYDIPHHRTTVYGSGWRGSQGTHPFRTGAWRAPSNNTNTFARESQIDAMASVAGIDSLEFRLMNLKDSRMIRVLKAAAERFGWKPAKAPSGRGLGISCGIDAGTYVAHIAEVEVDKSSGHIQVKRVVCAQDMGLSVNPEGAKIQIEGCITMGLGYALAEEIHFKGGEIRDLNFDTYEITRFSWTPEIETVLIDAKDSPPQGGGEPAIICMGAVVANAVHDAVGVGLLQLPMTPERVKAALAAKG
jgi:nicotinate dehydrogenase subunit B